jgi:hypothetical protein
MEPQDALGSGSLVRLSFQMVDYVDAPYHQHLVLCLDLTNDIRRQVPLSGGNPARLQRAAKGTRQSTTGRRDKIVYCRGVRWV